MANVILNSQGQPANLVVEKQYRTISSTLSLLFKSRRFLLLLATSAVSILVYFIPELAPAKEVITQIIGLAALVVVGYSMEDAIGAWASNRPSIPDNNKDMVKEMVDVFWIEFQNKILEQAPSPTSTSDQVVPPPTPPIR